MSYLPLNEQILFFYECANQLEHNNHGHYISSHMQNKKFSSLSNLDRMLIVKFYSNYQKHWRFIFIQF